jgi:hypothetical protein
MGLAFTFFFWIGRQAVHKVRGQFWAVNSGADLVGLVNTSFHYGASAVIQQLIRLLKLLLGLHSTPRRQIIECMQNLSDICCDTRCRVASSNYVFSGHCMIKFRSRSHISTLSKWRANFNLSLKYTVLWRSLCKPHCNFFLFSLILSKFHNVV